MQRAVATPTAPLSAASTAIAAAAAPPPTPVPGLPVAPPPGVRAADPATGGAVRLTSSSAASPVALPVQRALSAGAITSRLRKLASPQRSAEPAATSVAVGRGAAGGGGRATGPPRRAAAGPPPAAARSAPDPPGEPPGGTAAFDARKLSDGQVDELTHRLIGPLTRLLRTELRLDRERIGRLRDTRR